MDSTAIAKTDNGNGTSTWTWDNAAGTTQVRCNECDRWRSPSESAIRHAKHCDSKAQHNPAPAAAAKPEALEEKLARPAVRRAIREGGISAVLSEDEIAEGVAKGQISYSNAMNRDF